MKRVFTMGFLTLSVLGTMTGCGRSPATTHTGDQPQDGDVADAAAADPATEPIARVAYEFLDAVLKGDTQRAGAQLTPTAMQRIIESGRQFAPPGLEEARFQVGEVRLPSESQALVQCLLIAAMPSGETRTEEMCCLMRRVDAGWRVSGIAYSEAADRPPVILDFEQQPDQPPVAGSPDTHDAPSRPSPPRTAHDAAPAPVR